MTVYTITSPTFSQASPARLADYLRGHWAIQNGLHTSATPPSPRTPPRSASGPAPTSWPAQPRHRRAQPGGPTNLAAALRHHARDPARPLATLGITLG